MFATCFNCDAEVRPEEGRTFEKVFICPACEERAKRLEERLKRELEQMLIFSREAIRVALMEKRLFYPEVTEREISKAEVLKLAIELEERRRASIPSPAGSVPPPR